MTLDALIMLSGFLVAVLPFLGFPIQWDNIILVVLGVFVVALGIFVRRRGVVKKDAAEPAPAAPMPPEPAPIHSSEPQYGEPAGQ